MTTRYRVRDWDQHFENSRSRDYKKLDWVPLPNKHDGKGYRRLIALENGPALFAAWVLIVQVASKCPQRGVLADEDGPLLFERDSDVEGKRRARVAHAFGGNDGLRRAGRDDEQ